MNAADTTAIIDPNRPPATVATTSRFHWGRWVSAAIIILALAWIVWTQARNPNLDWGVVGKFLFNKEILDGLLTTIELGVFAEIIALILGLLIGYARVSTNPVASTFAAGYVWLFRSVPVLVQILILGNLALFAPMITINIPFTSIVLLSGQTNSLVPPFAAAIFALALHDAAYNAEIFRSGIISVPEGQRRASEALGLTWWQAQRHVVLPQAIPVMLPPAFSQFISLLKTTSLVSVIAVPDLLTAAQTISTRNLRTIELLFVASFWFIVLVAVSTVLTRWIERRTERRQKARSLAPVGTELTPADEGES